MARKNHCGRGEGGGGGEETVFFKSNKRTSPMMAELELRVVGRILRSGGVGLVLEILLSTDTAQRVYHKCSAADPDPGSSAFLTPGSRIRDPGSGMGKKSGS